MAGFINSLGIYHTGIRQVGDIDAIKVPPDNVNAYVWDFKNRSYVLITPSPLPTHFNFSQPIPMSKWLVVHNLGRIPTVVITSIGGEVVYTDIVNTDFNNLVINFSKPFAGYAYLTAL